MLYYPRHMKYVQLNFICVLVFRRYIFVAWTSLQVAHNSFKQNLAQLGNG